MRFAAFIALLCLVPTWTFALSAEICSEALNPFHEAEGNYERLGNSLVLFDHDASYSAGGELSFSFSEVVFVHCKSGKTVSANSSWMEDKGATFNAGSIRNAIKRLVKSTEAYSMEDVVKSLKDEGFPAKLETSTEELCACKAFYPWDRGSKTPYVDE